MQVDTSRLTRDAMIEHHIGLVHHIARQIFRSLSGAVDLEDLISYGMTGLITSVDKFDSERGLAFSTMAAPRIRGAILDEIRRADHVPRTLRKKERDLTRAREHLEHTLNRTPTSGEMADALELSMDAFWALEAEVEQAKQIRLDSEAFDDDTGTSIGLDILADDRYGDIEEQLTKEREVEILRDAILNLKEQEQVVLSLYYYEDLTLKQIAAVLNVSESRVSQIRVRVIEKLRTSLAALSNSIML